MAKAPPERTTARMKLTSGDRFGVTSMTVAAHSFTSPPPNALRLHKTNKKANVIAETKRPARRE